MQGFIAEAIPSVAALKRDVGIIRQTAQNIERTQERSLLRRSN